MADTTLVGLLRTGNHASRPTATAVGSGSLYSCSTHSLIYQSNGSVWNTWATGGGGGATELDDLTDVNAPTPADGDALIWDATPGEWVPGAVAAAGGGGTAFVGCSVSRAALQSLNDGSNTTFSFDTETFDSDGFWTISDPTKVTIPAGMSGKYLVTCYFNLTHTNAAFDRRVQLSKNGVAHSILVRQYWTASTGISLAFEGSTVVDLVAGDYLTMQGYNNVASNSAQGKLDLVKLDSGKVGSAIGAKAYNSALQAITNSTVTPVTFDSEEFDTDGFHSTASLTSRFTVPAGLGGKYRLTGGTNWGNGTPGNRIMWWRKNGTTDLRGEHAAPGASVDTSGLVVNDADLVAGDYVELMAYQDSGGSRNIGHASGAAAQSYGSIMRLDSGGGGPLNNLTATTDPAVGDDSADGYVVGSQWLNTTTRVLYVCKSNALGAAVWHSMSGNYVVLSVGTSATAYVPDASIPRVAAGYFRDMDGNSGAGMLQWYRAGSFNSLQGLATSSHGYQFQGSTLSGGVTGFSFFIESNAAGARLGVKNNNAGFGRDFLICVF